MIWVELTSLLSLFLFITLVSTLTVTPPSNQINDVFQFPMQTPTEMKITSKVHAIGNDSVGPEAYANFEDPPGEIITLRYLTTLTVIGLVVVSIYLVSKYHNQIITHYRSI